jgi:hypothetical protein
MRPLLLAIAVLLSTSASVWGQEYDKFALLRVPLLTEAGQVAGCVRVGITSDNSPEDLRKKILRMGGDTGLVTFDLQDPDKINAEVYRCPKPVAPTAAPSAPGDPTAVHNVLLGAWSGTMSFSTADRGLTRRVQLSATVYVENEGGQLRWKMAVDGPDLDGLGTVTHYFSDVTLTGTYGPGGHPVTYSLKLGRQTLQGSGMGPDHITRTLSLRKKPEPGAQR